MVDHRCVSFDLQPGLFKLFWSVFIATPCHFYTPPSPSYPALFSLARAERRDQILLNERCLLKGWTPLHYAAAEGSPSGVATLLAAGASVNVHGAVLAGIDSSNSSSGTGSGNGAASGTLVNLRLFNKNFEKDKMYIRTYVPGVYIDLEAYDLIILHPLFFIIRISPLVFLRVDSKFLFLLVLFSLPLFSTCIEIYVTKQSFLCM